MEILLPAVKFLLYAAGIYLLAGLVVSFVVLVGLFFLASRLR